MVEEEGVPKICFRCGKLNATHLEPVKGYKDEMPVCDECAVVEFPPGFSIEWVNDIGMTKRDRRYCLLGAKRAVVHNKYKWGMADIVGVIITVTKLNEDEVGFNVDFRVQEIVKVRWNNG